jgi:N-sulfoglucosamine sulfohydrolase
LLPILEQTDSVGFDRIFATHSFHEVNQYYPMRSVRTTRCSYSSISSLVSPFLNMQKQLKEWRAATHDPWLAGITDPFGHAH